MATDLVIILSSDWVESTATRAHVGEETADALQELHDTLLRRVIAADGEVVKHSGDGVLATFRSATAGLSAAVKIQQDFATYRSSPDALARLDIRVGLAAGDVQHQGGDIFGMPVIEAVRLQAAAQPNEILCSDLVRVLSQGRGGFVFEDAGKLQLKGLPAPVHAQRVRRADPAVATGSHALGTRTASVPPAAPGNAAPRPASTRRVLAAAALAVVIAGAALAAYRFAREPSVAEPERAVPAAAQSAAPRAPQSHSIAILPFANLSPSEADAYFAIGIHEEILNQLTKLGSLRVVARTTVQRYVGTQKSISEIARELNVETVMEGSVRYADGRVLVTTQLIDGATDVHLWSEKYERDFNNIFAIQGDIAVKVAQALKAELLPEERERIDRVPTTSIRAYDLYLSAGARAARQTAPDNRLAIEELDEATAIDPNFALAWVRKAGYLAMQPYFDPAGSAEHKARSLEAARRAIDIDPTLGDAYAALSSSLFTLRDWSGSEAAFRKARSLNTPLGDMPSYSLLHLTLGDFAGARDILQEGMKSNPQNSGALAFLVMTNALLGEWETAKQQYELGKRSFTPWGLGDTLMTGLLVGRNELDAARRIPPSSELDAAMLAKLDTPQAALLELRRLYDGADPAARGGLATWAAHFGDSALALEALRAAATQDAGILSSVWLPQFAEARRLPQFKTLMRDLGVVAYWREYGWPAVCRPLRADDFECD